MSYGFHIEVDTGGVEPHSIEPFFDDNLPALGSAGIAGLTVITDAGHSRCGNYTPNVSGMWRKCLTAALEKVPGAWALAGTDDRRRNERNPDRAREVATDTLSLRDLDGARCDDLAPLLAAAFGWGVEHIEELRKANPENGWGDAEGAVTYLWDIQRSCERHPAGRLRVSS